MPRRAPDDPSSTHPKAADTSAFDALDALGIHETPPKDAATPHPDQRSPAYWAQLASSADKHSNAKRLPPRTSRWLIELLGIPPTNPLQPNAEQAFFGNYRAAMFCMAAGMASSSPEFFAADAAQFRLLGKVWWGAQAILRLRNRDDPAMILEIESEVQGSGPNFPKEKELVASFCRRRRERARQSSRRMRASL